MGDEGRKTELLVGLFLLVGLLLLGVLILQFSSLREAMKPRYKLNVTFPSAAGLIENAPVKLGGATVGEVSAKPRLNPRFNGVIIELEIFSEYQVPEGSEFVIGSSGLMGDKLLEIRPPDPGEITGKFLKPGSVHEGKGTGGLGALEDAAFTLTTKTEDVLIGVEEAIELLAEAVRNLESGFLSAENATSFKESLEGLNRVIDKIDARILAEENIETVEGILGGLEETVGNFKEGSATLDEVMTKLQPVAEKLEPSIEKLEVALDKFGQTADSVKNTAKVASAKVAELEEGEGLLPMLLKDKDLKNQFTALISNLRRHGILRYKNSASESKEREKRAGGSDEDPAEKQARTEHYRVPYRR